MNAKVPLLLDLGERRVIKDILPRFVQGVGDDCAIVETSGSRVVVTTDPVPEPAAAMLAGDTSLFWKGWLLVTINASDLAAAGAEPRAFLAAIDAPPTLPVRELEALLEGILASCVAQGLKYVGGNLREGERIAAVGTAIGECLGWKPLRRKGASSKDLLVSVGAGGIFWRDAIGYRRSFPVKDPMHSPVFAPVSQLGVVSKLARQGLVRAAMDNSDGLLPTLNELCYRNGLNIRLELDALRVDKNETGIDPARLWLGWGDWNVIAAVRPEDLAAAEDICRTVGVPLTPIGTFGSEGNFVEVARGLVVAQAPRLESERFAADSWFAEGISGYVERLLNVDLP